MKKEPATLPEKQNFLAIPGKYSSLKSSKIAILPCPYERTTSYGKGTSGGPAAIIKASAFVEFFDEETQKEVCFEQGIATIKPVQFGRSTPAKALGIIHSSVLNLIDKGKFVVTLGGEHTISTAPIRAHCERFNELSILHFDAHSDLRDEYEGSRYSHASFAARVSEFTTKITQVGIRAQCREEFEFIKEKGIRTFYAYQMRDRGFNKDLINVILETLDTNVYITFDVDYFDPSIMPSTGTPEPNGFYWDETMRLLKEVCSRRHLVGFDVVELAPKKGLEYPDFIAARLVYKILSYNIW